MGRKKQTDTTEAPARRIRTLAGSLEWNGWADEFTESERIDFSKLVDLALEHYARHRKFRKPPRR
jgi:hypothetical protein